MVVRRRAASPTANVRPPAHGTSSVPASASVPTYKKLGSEDFASTVPGATSCGTGNTATSGASAVSGAYASTLFVVPRSIPMTYWAGTGS